MAIALFAINVHGLGMPSFFIKMPVFATIPTLVAVIFLALFIFYLTVIWGCAYDAYKTLYPSDFSRGTYIWSQISFAIPVLLPWLIISSVYDLIYALPFAGPQKIFATLQGQIFSFAIFLVVLLLVAPAMIQKIWGCKPLHDGGVRTRIEKLCRKAGTKYANILYWPIFGGRMITAAVLGLVKKFRYILVTDALIRVLEPEELDAVIAHEIGHVKKKHLLYYVFFFIGFSVCMVLADPFFAVLQDFIIYSKSIYRFVTTTSPYWTYMITNLINLTLMILSFLIFFRFIFGYFMRNFERQADGYVYALFDTARPLIRTLEKIAIYSGQPPDRPNWHHYSINERIAYLEMCEADRTAITRHNRKLWKGIAIYLAGVILVVSISLNFAETGAKLSNHQKKKAIISELEQRPDSPVLYKILGDIYYSSKNYILVKEAYEKSISLEPNNPETLNSLAWLYVTCPDEDLRNPFRGLRLAEKAIQLSKAAHIFDTLAESYFVNSMYQKAVVAETRALELVKGDRSYYEKQLEKFKKAVVNEMN
jgi:Zn-dependent protease with chaperone function